MYRAVKLSSVILMITLLVLVVSPWLVLVYVNKSTIQTLITQFFEILQHFTVFIVLVSVVAALEWFVSRVLHARMPNSEEKWLYYVIEEVKESTGIKRLRVRVIDRSTPQAFLMLDDIVVTKGLLDILNKEEVKSIILHELGHRRLVLFRLVRGLLTFAVFFNMSVLVKELGETLTQSIPWRSFTFTNPSIVDIMVFTVTTVLSIIVVLSLSRLEEHLADLYTVEVMRSDILASALSKLERERTHRVTFIKGIVKPLFLLNGVPYPSIKIRTELITSYYCELQKALASKVLLYIQ